MSPVAFLGILHSHYLRSRRHKVSEVGDFKPIPLCLGFEIKHAAVCRLDTEMAS